MYTYKITALNDENRQETCFVIVAPKPIDERLLQVVGLVLDEGLSPKHTAENLVTAQCFVSVTGEKFSRAKWIDDALISHH